MEEHHIQKSSPTFDVCSPESACPGKQWVVVVAPYAYRRDRRTHPRSTPRNPPKNNVALEKLCCCCLDAVTMMLGRLLPLGLAWAGLIAQVFGDEVSLNWAGCAVVHVVGDDLQFVPHCRPSGAWSNRRDRRGRGGREIRSSWASLRKGPTPMRSV